MINASEHIFVSYSRTDRKWLQKLQTVLTPIVRREQFHVWDDSQIVPGSSWSKEIKQALKRSKIALLFVSAEFLASNFIVKHELPLIYEAEKEGLIVLWIAVGYCMYSYTEIAEYQALNNPGRPLVSMRGARLDLEVVCICEHIRKAVQKPVVPRFSLERENLLV